MNKVNCWNHKLKSLTNLHRTHCQEQWWKSEVGSLVKTVSQELIVKNFVRPNLRHFSYASLVASFLLLSVLYAPNAQAISVPKDGTRTILSGTDCGIATYRFGTTATYAGKALDLLVEVISEDNDYRMGQCIFLNSNVLTVDLRDEDAGDNVAYMDLRITVVEKGTTIPVQVDRLTITGFDLDTNGVTTGPTSTGTDDIYLKTPDGVYISSSSLVQYSEGSFLGGQYQAKLKGRSDANCNDGPGAAVDITCRGGAIYINGSNGPNTVSSITVRLQNDNAYGDPGSDSFAVRRFQLSFEISEFEKLVTNNSDYGDAPNSYGSTGHSVGANIALGYGLVSDHEAAHQASTNADSDDNDGASSVKYDDEDGVRYNGQALNGQTLQAGTTSNLDITTFGTGYLSGWIDLNRDGDFNDAGEKVINDRRITSSTVSTSSAPITIPNSISAGTYYVRFRYTTTTGVAASGYSSSDGEVEDYQITIAPATFSVSGRVWNDADGNLAVNGSEAGTNAGSTNLTVYAVNGSGNVVGKATVSAADGTYSFSGLLAGNYTLRLSNNSSVAIGSPAPAASLPSGWINTGENRNGITETTTPGEIAVTVSTANVINQNFGIEQLPNTDDVNASSQTNPGGTNTIQVPALSGTDPEDGTLGSGKSFKIVTLPTTGTLSYNGSAMTAGQIISNYDPTRLTIDPNDGAITVSFTYAAIDAAGKEDPTPATVTMPFSPNLITCPVGSTATGSGYATGGIGQYLTKNAIYWLDWSCGATTQFNPGDIITKTWTAPNGISVTATLSNITKPLEPYTSGSHVGDRLQNLYNGPTSTGLINRNDAEDPSYKVTFSMTLNGVPIPSDIVTAEAESTDGPNEFASWTTDGDPWQPLEAAPNSSLKTTFSNGGRTIYMDDNPDGGFGVLVALAQNVSNITVNMNAGGKEAIAFGIMIPFDYGDAPATYGSASHYTRRLASGGSQPTTATNVNSLTMATLSYNTPYLGAIGADPETANQPTANADGDKLNGDNDEDAFTTLPTVPASGTYALNNIPVNNTTGRSGTLYAWVDFNKNGVFEASELTSTPVANNATSANLSWTVPSGSTPGTTYVRFRLTTQALADNPGTPAMDERSISVASDGEVEDYQVTIAIVNNPNVLLVKRITAVNNSTTTKNGDDLAVYKDENTNLYDDNTITVTNPNPPTVPADTDKWSDPATFLIGGTNGGNVYPGDELEYTIYFLSAGESTANNVLMCDRVPNNVTFLPTAFNAFGTKATGGLPGSDRGIQWRYNGVEQSLTNVNDGDAARYFPPGADPTQVYPNVNCGGANTNGAIVVNLGDLPNAIAPGSPTNSYGWIRFRGRVK
jgi:uncharacterized repeat protein (TIGR01451 family)